LQNPRSINLNARLVYHVAFRMLRMIALLLGHRIGHENGARKEHDQPCSRTPPRSILSRVMLSSAATNSCFFQSRNAVVRCVRGMVASLVGRTVPTSAKSSQSLILSVPEPLSRQSVGRQVSSSRSPFNDFHGLAQCHGQARAVRFCVTESDIISEGVELTIKTSLTCGLVMARTAGLFASSSSRPERVACRDRGFPEAG
jgi:hypothetical protein